ncbi:MAG TPA: 50S ribosomal protein L24 [Stellaceae bacterium]|nr:50S ribosomal protein L24 [Stellaceae bacterium]
MAAKIKKGDTVQVISGAYKGRSGEVLSVLTDRDRVVVRGVAMAKRHTKPSMAGQGGIVDKELSIHVSNVAHIDPKTKKPTRVGFKLVEGGRKVRFAKRSGEILDR